MRISKSLEDIWRVKEKISTEISNMSHEEIIQYFKAKQPPELGNLHRFEKPVALSQSPRR